MLPMEYESSILSINLNLRLILHRDHLTLDTFFLLMSLQQIKQYWNI